MVYRTSKYEIQYQAIKEVSEEEMEKGKKVNISLMCKILGIKRANYYKWLHHKKSERDLENEELATLIQRYDEMFDHTLGYRMMADRINRDENKNYNDKRIYKIMRILGIQSRIRAKRRSCTIRKRNNTADNVLKRDFNASRPNEKWLSDVTEFKYGKHKEKKLYLSAILNLYDRSIVGYQIGEHNDNPLVFESFKQAMKENPGAQPLVHSDGGYQYTSRSFIHMLNQNQMTQSMSRVHCCIDNGPMEGFWGILKSEMYHGKKYETREEIETAIKGWIRYYTFIRYQRRFGIKTPYEVRMEALESEHPTYYPIPLNPSIIKYKQEHYRPNYSNVS